MSNQRKFLLISSIVGFKSSMKGIFYIGAGLYMAAIAAIGVIISAYLFYVRRPDKKDK